MGDLHKVDDKTSYVEAYHAMLKAVDAFQLLSPNIPKQFLCLVQQLYTELYKSTCYIRDAANTFETERKQELISNAKLCILNVFTALEIIVRGKGLTIGGANTVIDVLADVMEQCNKWLKSSKAVARRDS